MSTASLTWRAVLDDVRGRLAAAGWRTRGRRPGGWRRRRPGASRGLASGLGGWWRMRSRGAWPAWWSAAGGEPLQYVLGRWGFRRLELAVDPRVLIPRPETEVLAELALAA